MLDEPRSNLSAPRSYLGLNWKDILRQVLEAQQSARDHTESHKPPDHSDLTNVTRRHLGNAKSSKSVARLQRLNLYRKTLTNASNTYRPLLSWVHYSSGITPALAGNGNLPRRQYLYATQRIVDLTRATSAAFLSRYTNQSSTRRYGPPTLTNQTVVVWKRPERSHRLLSSLPDMPFYIAELIEYRDIFRHICRHCRGAGDVRGQEHSLVLTRAMFKLWVYQHLAQAKASLDLLLNRFFDQFASSPSQGMDFTDYFFMIALLSKSGPWHGFQCSFDSYDLNGDGNVDSHDIFTAISRGYQYIFGNDVYALSKCVSGTAARKRSALESGIDRDGPILLDCQDFYSASLDDTETDLGKLVLDVFYRLLRTRSSVQIHAISETASPVQDSDRLPLIQRRRVTNRVASSMVLPDITLLSSEQLMGLKAIFDHSCQSPHSEEMSRKALADALRFFVNDAAAVTDDVIYDFLTLGFDQNRTWALGFTEFAQRIAELFFGLPADQHRIVFQMIDKNNDGQLTLPELYSILEDQRLSPIFSKDIEPLMDQIVSRNHDPAHSENVVTFQDVTRIWKRPQALSVFKKDIWEAIEAHNDRFTAGKVNHMLATKSARAVPILLPPILRLN